MACFVKPRSLWRSKKHSNCCALCRNQLVTESIKGIDNKLFERAPLRDNLIAPQRSLRDGGDCWFKSSMYPSTTLTIIKIDVKQEKRLTDNCFEANLSEVLS